MTAALYDLLFTFAWCLSLTVAAELIFALICGIRGRRDLLLVALVNVITNPWVVFLNRFAAQPSDHPTAVLLLLEAGAIAAEALIYRRYALTIKRCWLFSAGANAFSVFIGQALGYILLAALR